MSCNCKVADGKCGQPDLIENCCYDHAILCYDCNCEPAHPDIKICCKCNKESLK